MKNLNLNFTSFNKIAPILIFLIPIGSSFGSFISDLFLSITALGFLIFLIKKKYFKYLLNKYVLFFSIFWIVISVNSLFSINPKVSFIASFFFIRFLFFSLCIYYFCETSPGFVRKMYNSILYMFAVLIIFGFLELITGYNIFNTDLNIIKKIISGEFTTTNERISIFFYDEKILGGHLLRWLTLYVVLFFFNYADNTKNDIYRFFIVFLLVSILIVSSGERSTIFLYCLFSVLFFTLLQINYKKKILVFAVVLFSQLLLITNNPELYKRLFKHSIQYGIKEDGKWNLFSKQHEAHYKSAINIFLKHPYFGSGVKTFRFECSKEDNVVYFNNNSSNGCATHPHNTYLQLLSETGLFGFFFISFLFIFCSVRLFNNYFFSKLKFTNLQKYYTENFMLLHFFIFLWPIIPTGSFFHNWTFSSYYFPMGFLIYFYKLKLFKN